MPNTLPTPFAAALGVIPTAIDNAKRVPTKVVQLPILVVSTALTRWAEAQQRYDELAERGERFVASVRGRSNGLDASQVQEWLAEAVPTENGERPDLVTQVSDALDQAGARKPQRHDTAATADVVALVEDVASAVDVAEPSHDELPLPDYDHMTIGSLRGRLRSLTVDELVAVREYEKAHAHRLPVVTLLDNRIAKVSAEEPAGGDAYPGSTAGTAGAGKKAADAAKKAAREDGGTLRV